MGTHEVHHYVLEHIGGSLKARAESRVVLWMPFGISLFSSVIILLSNTSDSSTIGLALCVLLAGIPFGAIAQRTTLKVVLSRESLRLKRFLIGKKGYIAPKDHVLHEQADLFAIAANLVCREPFLSPQSNAAAWHTFSTLVDVPGVAVNEGWYGNNTQASVFLYGDLRQLMHISSDIWDLGHVRKLAASDKERFHQTSKGWKRQHLLSVGLAYAPLSKAADPTHLTAQDIKDNCVLLGALGLESTRGYEQTIPINPRASVMRATAVQAVISMTLALLALLSSLGMRFFEVAPPVNMLLVLGLGVIAAPILLAAYSWDHAAKQIRLNLSSLIWNSSLIAGLSYSVYLAYLYWQNALNASVGSLAQQSGSALTILTAGLCILAYASFERLDHVKRIRFQTANPLYLLAWASSLLIVLIISYGSGPLLLGGILMALGTTLGYIAIHEIHAYADRHHSRDLIIELLKI